MIKMIDKSLALARKLEAFFGYRKIVEHLISHFYGIFFYRKIKDFFNLNKDKKIIMVSLGIPGYLEHISSVLEELSNNDYLVIIFPEWHSDAEAYDQQLSLYLKPSFKVFYNCSRVMPLFEASVFLSSIAGKKFYFPKNCERLFYFHSVSGLDGFPPGGLDAYDTILAATAQQVKQLRSKYANLKRIVSAGYPKLDKIISRIQESNFRGRKEKKITIIFAPSFSNDNIYKDVSTFRQSEEIIELLLINDYEVIFRPHPLFFKKNDDRDFIYKVIKRFGADVTLDDSSDYFESYMASSGMLTDVSGTSFIYRVAFELPVLFFTPRSDLAREAFSLIDCIGEVVQHLDEIPPAIARMLNEPSKVNQSGLVFSIGSSAEVFINEIERATA